MSIIPLINPKVQKKNRRGRGPGKSNIKGICACYLADLIQGTANDWATSPKRIIEGIGAPVSHEYLRKALKLSAADRWGVELGLSSLVSACTTNTPISAASASSRLQDIVAALGVSATLDLLADIAAQVEIAA